MRAFISVFLLLLYLLSGHPAVPDPAVTPKEYQVKAAFLFNFTRFVEWPSDAFLARDAPLVIGILGEDPFGGYLEGMVNGESVGNHPLVVRRFEKMTDIKDCHVLFISETDSEGLAKVLHHLNGKNILTVGEGGHFGPKGGMIGFVPNGDKIGIQVNVGSARRANIGISSKLLRLAEIVATEPNP